MLRPHGIIFQPEMILAYLAREKNQTRRVKGLKSINQDPDAWQFIQIVHIVDGYYAMFEKGPDDKRGLTIRLPYGSIGDTLYFKETWRAWEHPEGGEDFIEYRADEMILSPLEFGWDPDKRDDWDHLVGRFDKWQSGMFMAPRFARFRDIPIVNVKIQRLHDITEAEAKLEGVKCPPPKGIIHSASHREEYFTLWDKINGKTLPASKNPWVWVYEFPLYDNKYAKLKHNRKERYGYRQKEETKL